MRERPPFRVAANHARAVRSWPAMTAPGRRPVPAPGGLDARQYASVLGVAALDPWAPPGQAHVLYLLHDDLDAVRRLLGLGITAVGPLGEFLGTAAASSVLGPERAVRLRWRIAALDAFVGAWREGRGRPLAEADLVDAPVSARFRAEIDRQVRAAGGSASRVLAALEAGAVPRFGIKARTALHGWLTTRGFLDERDALGACARLRRVLEAAPVPLGVPGRTAADAVAHVRWLEAAVRSLSPAAPAEAETAAQGG